MSNDYVYNEKEKMEKRPYCLYDSSVDFENATGGLRFYIPADSGYVNYNLVHSVYADRNCDTWRLSMAYGLDNNLENEYPLTPHGAEWDMALKISGRADFIGGYNHGDEVYTVVSMKIDGKSTDMQCLEAITPFNEIIVTVESQGFDPNDSVTEALKHYKEYTINENGVTLKQRVEWLNDYTVAASYMAMMPPLKSLTDSFYTNVDRTTRVPNEHYKEEYQNVTEAVVYGSHSGVSFSMSAPQYPSLPGGGRFFLSDNIKGLYNKMYFAICDGAEVHRGDVWESVTQYSISIVNS